MAVAPKKEAEVFRLLLKIGFTPINNSKRKKADIAFGTQVLAVFNHTAADTR